MFFDQYSLVIDYPTDAAFDDPAGGMDTKLARLTNHFLGYYNLHLIQFGHFADELSPKTTINEHPLNLLQ